MGLVVVMVMPLAECVFFFPHLESTQALLFGIALFNISPLGVGAVVLERIQISLSS